VKRVVTGWNGQGEAVVLFEGEPSGFDFGQASSMEVWSTEAVPASYSGTADAAAGDFKVEPPLGGSVCRIAVYKPGASVEIHTTQTVDYIIVISGELTMVLEDREIVLYPGDVVVQQATPHGWANRADTECVVAAVLVTAEGASSDKGIDWP
jgi:quercetin dioxygenase-like cupin family protein